MTLRPPKHSGQRLRMAEFECRCVHFRLFPATNPPAPETLAVIVTAPSLRPPLPAIIPAMTDEIAHALLSIASYTAAKRRQMAAEVFSLAMTEDYRERFDPRRNTRSHERGRASRLGDEEQRRHIQPHRSGASVH